MTNSFGSKVTAHAGRALKVLNGDLSTFPVTVHIGPMAGCNHDCIWCSDREYRKKYPGYLDSALFLESLQEMRAGGVESLVWIGSGEPTLHPDFPMMVKFAATLGFKQGLVTNGSKLPVHLIDAFSWVRVSLDAGTAKAHSLLHVVNDYDVVLSNIQKACELRTSDVVIGVSYLLCQENYEGLGDFVKKLDSWGVDYIQIKRLASTPGYTALPMDVPVGPFEVTSIDVMDDDVAESTGGNAGLPCWSSSLNTVIAPTGDVMLCCRLSNTGRDEEAVMGNLFTDGGFKAVWLGSKRREVVERFRDPAVTRSCPSCWMTPLNVEMDKLSKSKALRNSLPFI